MLKSRPRLIFAALAACGLASRAAAHPPSAIAVDDRGRVFFTDSQLGVYRLDPGSTPTLVNKSAMHWMAVDPDGKFAQAPDEFGQWFGRLTPPGEKPTLISCSDFPCAIGRDGNLYYAHMHSLKIIRRTPDGKESVLISPEKFGIDLKRPVGVPGLACAPDGTIYLVTLNDESGEHVVYAVTPDGSPREFAKNFIKDKLPAGQRHHESRPEYCRGMAIDREGNVYIAATGNRSVIKLTPKGEPTTILKLEKPWSPTGVDVFEGAVYVLEYDDETPTTDRNWPLRVRKLDKNGTSSIIATARAAL